MAPLDGGIFAVDTRASVEADPVLRCLRDGRARIETSWGHPGAWSEGAVCIVMSLEDPDVEVVQSANRYLKKALRGTRPAGRLKRDALYTLNDSPSTTKADVLALFDGAMGLRRRLLGSLPRA